MMIILSCHKALYFDEWVGLPDEEFLSLLDPRKRRVAKGLYDKAHDATTPAGQSCEDWARKLGTSTCDCAVVKMDKTVADIPGICGVVPGAILPGYYGIEAGQSAVGDIF